MREILLALPVTIPMILFRSSEEHSCIASHLTIGISDHTDQTEAGSCFSAVREQTCQQLQNLIRVYEVRSSPFLESNSILKAICRVQPHGICSVAQQQAFACVTIAEDTRSIARFCPGFEIFER